MKKHRFVLRYSLIIFIFVASMLAFSGKLFNIQVANSYDYRIESGTVTKRYTTVKALRGKIYDRNGELLVTNRLTYNVTLNRYLLGTSNLSSSVYKLIRLFDENGIAVTDRFAITDSQPFEFKKGYFDSYSGIFKKYAKDNISIENYTASQLIDHLIDKYSLHNYDKLTARRIIGQLFELYVGNFGYGNVYHIAENISSDIALNIADKILLIPGVELTYSSERVIVHGDLCAHILGTVGEIHAEDYPSYALEGYAMDAIVGISGAEKAFESYLKGTDGTIVQEIDENGNVINSYFTAVPVAGKNVYLTIDADLQRASQTALAETIIHVAKTAKDELSGKDANAGAVVVQDPESAEILAIASYPTYDLSRYKESAYYNEISSKKVSHLVNRATSGLYEPGSTFKVLTAFAALEENIIEKDTVIRDLGSYTKYAPSYSPRCWIYARHGYTHGNQTVITALQNSCNYYFFDIGDRLGIDKLNEYSKKFGLGLPTGIETGEKSGILAGPEYRNTIESIWMPGDTLQASIGQSDNLFTPLQLSNYMCTLLNGGTRYQTHLLYAVKDYYYDTVHYSMPPVVLSRVEMSEDNLNTVKTAMRKVIEDGTASATFNKFRVEVGGKTGSAQVSNGSANAIFIGFAPYEAPEIVVTVVLEHGSAGSNAALVTKKILEAYFPE